jgi:hypothetical protein
MSIMKGKQELNYSQEKLLGRDDLTSDVTRDGYGKLIPTGVPAGMMRSDRTSLQLTSMPEFSGLPSNHCGDRWTNSALSAVGVGDGCQNWRYVSPGFGAIL